MDAQSFPLTPWQRVNLPGDKSCLLSYQIFFLTVDIPLEPPALTEAIKSLTRRRDNLRINLTSRFEQQIAAHVSEPSLERLDLTPAGGALKPFIERIISDMEDVISSHHLYRFYVTHATPACFTLAFSYSPVIADPHSVHLIMEDVAKLYRAELSHGKLPLEDPPSFLNYLGKHYSDQPHEVTARRNADSGSPEVGMPLYSGIASGSTESSITLAGSSIDEEISQRISYLSTQNSCEDHEVIYSATACYLSQLLDQGDFTVVLSSYRGRPDKSAHVAGPCSVVLSIRNQVDPTASFTFNLKHLTRSLRHAYGNEHSSRITDADEPLRTDNRHNGAIVWINLVTVPTSTHGRDASLVSAPPLENGLRLITIDFYIREDQSPFYVSCSSNTLEGSYATSLIDGLVSFMGHAVTSPEVGLTKHELVSKGERDRILLRWNNTKSTYPNLCVHELFEKQTESTPHRTAIEFKGKRLTYADLNCKSNQLAHHIESIRSPSKQPGASLVGICVDRSLEMVIGLLGAIKAGCAYVPIDPSYPEERIEFLVKDAGINILLTQRHLAGKVGNLGRSIIFLDDELSNSFDKLVSHVANNIPPQQVNLLPSHPVAVLYTSGSTGNPKGVFISHRGLVSRLQWMQSTFPFTEDEVAGHIAQLPFVRALWELFVPLTAGIKVVIIDLHTTKDPENLSRSIGDHKITRLVTAPSLAQTLVSSPHHAAQGLHALKYWFIGGESLHYKVVEAIRKELPTVSICNLYGATEVHSFASCYPVIGEADESARVPIGRAIDNTSILILDRHNRVLPVGIHGEICVLGDGVASGYLKQPELTAAKFTEHGFSDLWSSSLYRTGDIGYCLPDGNIMFVSRLDHQVKIRGIRVELGEVESALLAHKDVEKAVVVSSEFGPSDFRLVAYVVPRLCSANVRTREWRRRYIYVYRRFLEQKLPVYMIPSYFVILEKLPLNAYGKVLRKELPAPDVSSVGSIGYHPPRNERETLLCTIWEDILGIDKIGVLDNFFDLGGHSLLASRIKARVSDAFSIDLPLRDIFERPSVSELAESVNNLARRNSDRAPLTRAADCIPAPLTEEMGNYKHILGTPSTLSHFGLRIYGKVDVGALRESLAYLIQRHDALRMIFMISNNDTFMLPSLVAHVDFRVIDIHHYFSGPEASGRSEKEILRDQILDLLSRPSDITSGCLTRWALFQVRPLESFFVGVLDHAVADGTSVAILKRELKLVYEAYCKGHEPNLAPLAFRYLDYAHWQERHRATASYLAEKQAHRECVQKAHSSAKRIEASPAPDSTSYYHKLHSVDRATQCSVSDFCARAGVTESVFYTAATHLALRATFNQDDILILMWSSGRRFLELEDVVGLFAHCRYIQSELAGAMPLVEFIARTRRSVSDAQSTGYTHLEQKDFECLSEMPIADVVIDFRNFPGDQEWELFNLEVKSISFSEKLDSLAVSPFSEKSPIILRVEKYQTHDIVGVYGGDINFPNDSFEQFNNQLAYILGRLPSVSNLLVSIDDVIRSE